MEVATIYSGPPLQSVSDNPQCPGSSNENGRESSVHDKIHQFNTLAMKSKHLERRTADAALKRAMLGREEAETEMRRHRDEAQKLRRLIDEGRERERRVGERLETIMENYGRAKETHAHTQALWEKEIRRARKESFKSQSTLVKLQEELKSVREAQKSSEEAREREKERSKAREQEAFSARYALVGLQEQLGQALERVKMLEQERDAFKTLAKSEEDVARIAAEGMLPLPRIEAKDDEFASPIKKRHVCLSHVKSSAASEAEMDELTEKWLWERQRANRALEHVEFLEAECRLKCCPCAKDFARSGLSPRRGGLIPSRISDAGDLVILSGSAPASPTTTASIGKSKTEKLRAECEAAKERRRSAIFVPEAGISRAASRADTKAFETQLSRHEAGAIKTMKKTAVEAEVKTDAAMSTGNASCKPPTPDQVKFRLYSRTPSVEPPAFALLPEERNSLLSAGAAPPSSMFHMSPGPAPTPRDHTPEQLHKAGGGCGASDYSEERTANGHSGTLRVSRNKDRITPDPHTCPHGSIAAHHDANKFFSSSTNTLTTTTKVPLREETSDPSLGQRLLQMQNSRTPSRTAICDTDTPSFDASNPAMTPTMTREEALAQIRERRGRARSGAAATTPRPKRPLTAEGRREVSAPMGVTPGRRRVGS